MKFVRVAAPTNADEMRAYLERKTVEDDITGCMVWQGSAHLGQFPQMRWGDKASSARRVIYEMLRGTINSGWQIGVRDTCHCLCVTPEHLVQRSRAKAGKGHPVALSTKIKIAQARRAKSPLDPDAVAEIRASAEPGTKVAEQLQVSVGAVSRIRRGETWREYTGPWAGLMRA